MASEFEGDVLHWRVGDKFILGAAFSQWFINFRENKAPLGLYSIAVPTWYLAIQADQNRLGFATMVTF
jgi:hypothetical protein